ncbi:MAG: hypothetical protein C5B44_06795 [Acidobacteria bacterium]|nr:MAG: hypothetical protein C5B44_06795 [Acidobacteriota bacterium]
MREKALILLAFLAVTVVFIVLSTATYVKEEEKRDSEFAPDRSSYHSGPTGLRAFYDFLSESGYRVMRWREHTEKLLGPEGRDVKTFVVVGRTKLEFEETEARNLLQWVTNGGWLVLVDRTPRPELLPAAGGFTLDSVRSDFSGFTADPANRQAMLEGVKSIPPVQPSMLTRDVESIMPSRLASRIRIIITKNSQNTFPDEDENKDKLSKRADLSPAPVASVADDNGALLVDYPHGLGRIVLLSDPYLVANNGVALQDNLQLALNIVTASGGLIAFDEYHQGRGVTQNALVGYFSGTPVLALCLQLGFLVMLVLWTKGRRFARPLPLPQIDRRSKLEFVASMAELQERSRAFDLAIENIYTRTRRVLARYAGVEYNSPRSEIAERVASRSSLDAREVESLMRQCEETINGAPTNPRRSMDLVKRLREVERALGLRMRSREVRQAAENI